MIPLFLVAESPIVYMVVKEALRQTKQLPMTESWETSPEKWKKAFDEYKNIVESKRPAKMTVNDFSDQSESVNLHVKCSQTCQESLSQTLPNRFNTRKFTFNAAPKKANE